MHFCLCNENCFILAIQSFRLLVNVSSSDRINHYMVQTLHGLAMPSLWSLSPHGQAASIENKNIVSVTQLSLD